MKNYSFVKVKSINKLQGAAYFDNSYTLIDDDNLYIYETEAKQRERFEIYKNNLQNSMSNSKFSYLTETTNTPCYIETIQVNEQQGKHIIWMADKKQSDATSLGSFTSIFYNIQISDNQIQIVIDTDQQILTFDLI